MPRARTSQGEFFFHDPITPDDPNLEEVRVISLHQPWATLCAVGAKKFETRGWKTPYRGLLAIHATKAWEEDEISLCSEEPFAKVLTDAGYRKARELVDLGGHVIAICRLADVQRMTLSMVQEAKKSNEYAFGGWSADEERYAWRLEDMKKLDTPIAYRGMQGLPRWPEGSKLFGTGNSL